MDALKSADATSMIPLKDLYNLQEGQEFIKSGSINPTYTDEEFKYIKSHFGDIPKLRKIMESGKTRTLKGTNYWSDIRVVDELDVVTGKPTGDFGFVVTRKKTE